MRITCPFCKNDDERMIEIVKMVADLNRIVTTYLCNNCSKTFRTEMKRA